jgi:acetyltransferase EpsM
MTFDPGGPRPKRQLILIGGGEHARVVLDAAREQATWDVVGFVDPKPNRALQKLGLAWWGDDDRALARLTDEDLILTLGGVDARALRRQLVERYAARGVHWASVVHPSCVVARDAKVAEGAAILARAVVNPGARIGPHNIINTGAIVEHDVELGTNVQVGPGAVIGGGVVVGNDTYIGLAASIRDHVRVGQGSVVGMGCVVIEDVAPGTQVAGVPARPIGSWSDRSE